MKVKTDLRAGNLLDELSEDAGQVYETVQSWISQQGSRVNEYTDAQIARAKNLWNCFLNA